MIFRFQSKLIGPFGYLSKDLSHRLIPLLKNCLYYMDHLTMGADLGERIKANHLCACHIDHLTMGEDFSESIKANQESGCSGIILHCQQ